MAHLGLEGVIEIAEPGRATGASVRRYMRSRRYRRQRETWPNGREPERITFGVPVEKVEGD
ncbi:MAG: hypothetical protein ACLGI2_14740 [Acidimicrobiia bacterium]